MGRGWGGKGRVGEGGNQEVVELAVDVSKDLRGNRVAGNSPG